MAKHTKVRDYFEPWKAEPRRLDIGEPFTEGLDPEQVSRAVDAHRRIAENAGWVVWGSRMSQPCDCTSLLGKPATFDASGILLVVRNPVGPEKCDIKAKEIAERVAECVTACRAVADPVATIDGVRDLLRDMASGTCDSEDSRVVSLLARLIPAEQMKGYEKEEL